ncbi:MAG: hypothetical protein PVI21_02975 [Candidatus Woesebacteria bacterium]|jgi:hypothetical protein
MAKGISVMLSPADHAAAKALSKNRRRGSNGGQRMGNLFSDIRADRSGRAAERRRNALMHRACGHTLRALEFVAGRKDDPWDGETLSAAKHFAEEIFELRERDDFGQNLDDKVRGEVTHHAITNAADMDVTLNFAQGDNLEELEETVFDRLLDTALNRAIHQASKHGRTKITRKSKGNRPPKTSQRWSDETIEVVETYIKAIFDGTEGTEEAPRLAATLASDVQNIVAAECVRTAGLLKLGGHEFFSRYDWWDDALMDGHAILARRRSANARRRARENNVASTRPPAETGQQDDTVQLNVSDVAAATREPDLEAAA